MLAHSFRIALRHMARNKLSAGFSIAGLAAGFAACLLISLYVSDELGYDRFHDSPEQIHRVVTEFINPTGNQTVTLTSAPMAPTLEAEIPEIESAVRFRRVFRSPPVFALDDKRFYEAGLYAASPEFFSVFDYPLLQGNSATALSEPFTLLLTKSLARKYFGQASALNQTVRVNGEHDFRVAGVLADVPANSHFPFAALASFSTLEALPNRRLDNWIFFAVWTYVRLRPGVDKAAVEAKLAAFVERHVTDTEVGELTLHLQPLTKIHLESDLLYEFQAGGDSDRVRFLAVVALVILILAALNFAILSLARSADRAREVGVRKAAGATQSGLVAQFTAEALVWTMLAFALGTLVAAALVPAFNDLAGKDLRLANLFIDPRFWVAAGVTVMAVTLVSSLYPAWILSSYQPAEVLRGGGGGTYRRAVLRRILVFLQFSMAIALMIITGVAIRQEQHLRTKDLGYDSTGLVVVKMPTQALADYATVRDEIRKLTGIADAAVINSAPPAADIPQGPFLTEESGPNDHVLMYMLQGDPRVANLLGLQLLSGRLLQEDVPSDATSAFVLNESAVAALGWTEAIGRRLFIDVEERREGEVIGVVKDFHFRSLREEVGPLAIFVKPDQFRELLVRLAPGEQARSLATLETAWRDLVPGEPFDATLLDETFDELYRTESSATRLGTWSTGFALLVACLGLIGLTGFVVERRRKEISIRKSVGASVNNVVYYLTWEFALLIVLANLAAWPLAWSLAQRWLENYPYRIALGPGLFLGAAALALTVALATVLVQTLRAAMANPADALRHE